MKRALHLAVALALAGCASLQIYTPADKSSSVEGMYCGAPYAWWRAQVAGITASLAAQPCPQGLCGTLRLAAGAARVTFLGNSIAVASDRESGSVTLIDPATRATLAAGAVVPPGNAPVDYVFAGPAPQAPTLLLAAPILQVDGQRLSLPPAKMILTERKTAAPCLP